MYLKEWLCFVTDYIQVYVIYIQKLKDLALLIVAAIRIKFCISNYLQSIIRNNFQSSHVLVTLPGYNLNLSVDMWTWFFLLPTNSSKVMCAYMFFVPPLMLSYLLVTVKSSGFYTLWKLWKRESTNMLQNHSYTLINDSEITCKCSTTNKLTSNIVSDFEFIIIQKVF